MVKRLEISRLRIFGRESHPLIFFQLVYSLCNQRLNRLLEVINR